MTVVKPVTFSVEFSSLLHRLTTGIGAGRAIAMRNHELVRTVIPESHTHFVSLAGPDRVVECHRGLRGSGVHLNDSDRNVLRTPYRSGYAGVDQPSRSCSSLTSGDP
jgi:hypothetical protein